MRKLLILATTAGALALMGLPGDAAAQGKGKGKVKERPQTERVERAGRGTGSGTLEDILRGGRGQVDPRERRDGAGKGPPFCRNGQGHPVHGRRWCVDKGFGLGNRLGSLGDIRWEDRGWEDIVFRTPRPEREVLDRRGLADVLGSVVLGRFDSRARALGSREPLTGRWLQGRDGPLVLWLQAGQTPVAQLLDLNRDGRVDRVRLNGGR